MKPLQRKLWSIAAIVIAASIIDLPRYLPIRVTKGPIHIDTAIRGPDIAIDAKPIVIRRNLATRLGLDLSGGTHLVLETDMKDVEVNDRTAAFDAAEAIVQRRVNLYGLTEPVVQQSKVGDAYRILVELPGISDANEAIQLIGKTAQLDFREEPASESAEQNTATPSAPLAILSMRKTGLTGKNLKKATPQFNTQTGGAEVQLEFNDEGAKLFEEVTEKNVGKPLGIFLDEQILSYPPPIVQSKISGGRAVISGSFTTEYAKNLAITLNAGALPVPIRVVEQKQVGATLEQESIQRSMYAGAIGLFIILVFMIYQYGFFGFLADVALVIYALITLAIFKLIPVTLTLAGIAGFILSIGMAVDANILIFERMKEEIRWGRDRRTAIRFGFNRAFSSIRDSNASSLITCTILYWFGTGMVRGFAITLAIGILVSLFSAITVTRTFLQMVYQEK